MESLRKTYSADAEHMKTKVWELNTILAKTNARISETNKLSKSVAVQLDLLEEKLKKYLDTEQILELEEKRMLPRMEFEPLEFLTFNGWGSEADFLQEAEKLEEALKLKAALVNLAFLCWEETKWTVETLAFPELDIMDAYYECVSLFRCYQRQSDLEKVQFYYGLRNTKFEPIIEQKHERHVACLYRILMSARELAASPLITKPTINIAREDCAEMKRIYAKFVKDRNDGSMLRTLCYEELKGTKESENINLFETLSQLGV
ncbi:MAG: hypothetical protein J6C07_03625 [Lachnospiraceae bacterium]|nr:hypothetical protein [Lachnospiraceae bacterium]